MSPEMSWRIATERIAKLGSFSALFTGSVSRIHGAKQLNFGQNPGRIREFAVDAVIPIVEHSRSIKAIFVHALPVLKNSPPHNPESLSNRELLSHFSADEICALVATTYLITKTRQQCPAKIWQVLVPDMLRHIEIAFMLGRLVHRMGPGLAILTAALRYCSAAVFAIDDQEGFSEYRALLLKQHTLIFDPSEEERRWKCNHLQIASLLVGKIGYGHRAGEGIALDALPVGKAAKADEPSGATEDWQLALQWTERIQTRDDWLHDIKYGGQEIGSREALVDLKRAITALPEHPSRFAWLLDKAAEPV